MTWVALITAALVAAHLLGDRLGRRLDTAEHAAHSFGGGMAVAYVFLHLLPELGELHEVLGHDIHVLALLGFVLFYAAEHWVVTSRRERAGGFWLRIFLHSVYNWLVIYSLPEAVADGLGYALLLSGTLALHLLSTDYSLRARYPQRFPHIGRWILAAALVAGFVSDLFYAPTHDLVSDTWTALLAGFVLCNVFRDEAPDHRRARFPWFLGGVLLYTGLSLYTA